MSQSIERKGQLRETPAEIHSEERMSSRHRIREELTLLVAADMLSNLRNQRVPQKSMPKAA